MKFRTLLAAGAAFLSFALAAGARAKDSAKPGEWMAKKAADWNEADTKEILNKSPWVQTVDVVSTTLVPPDTKGTGGAPAQDKISLYVRWNSAFVMREAFVRAAQLQSAKISDADIKILTAPFDRYYMISVSAPETLSILDTVALDSMAKITSLEMDDGQVLKLVRYQSPGDSRPPEAKFFFEKGKGISDQAKTATFKTKVGVNDISKAFDLASMSWPAPCPGDAKIATHRDLDGDYCPVSAEEKKRRDAQNRIVGDDPVLARAVTSVLIDKIENKGDPKRTWRVIVAYDKAQDPGADVVARKVQMAKGAGTWAPGNLAVIIFMDPATQKVADYLGGKDAENIASAKDDAARAKIFKAGEKKP